jgi:hypothetical protein
MLLTKELIEFTRFKWEFLRRNPEYISDQQAMAAYKKEGGKAPKICFLSKYGIRAVINPEESFNDWSEAGELYEICSYLNPYSLVSPIEIVDGWDSNGWDKQEIKEMLELWENPSPFTPKKDWGLPYPPSEEFTKTGVLTAKLDLTSPKKRLLKNFSSLVDEWKDIYECFQKHRAYLKFCEEKGISATPIRKKTIKEFEASYGESSKKKGDKKKLHFENFDLYLRVWDMREKEKMSWSKIASTLQLNSVQTARNHYQAACRLIKEGIDAYVK